jgi:hypothetical protein
MKELILSRSELDYMENNPIFTYWLFGDEIDESLLDEKEKVIIKARQMYYDLILPDERVYQVLDHLKLKKYDDLLNDMEHITSASRLLGVRPDILTTKVLLLKRRVEKRQALLKMLQNDK